MGLGDQSRFSFISQEGLQGGPVRPTSRATLQMAETGDSKNSSSLGNAFRALFYTARADRGKHRWRRALGWVPGLAREADPCLAGLSGIRPRSSAALGNGAVPQPEAAPPPALRQGASSARLGGLRSGAGVGQGPQLLAWPRAGAQASVLLSPAALLAPPLLSPFPSPLLAAEHPLCAPPATPIPVAGLRLGPPPGPNGQGQRVEPRGRGAWPALPGRGAVLGNQHGAGRGAWTRPPPGSQQPASPRSAGPVSRCRPSRPRACPGCCSCCCCRRLR